MALSESSVPVAGGMEVVTDWAVARPKPMMEERATEDFMMFDLQEELGRGCRLARY